jgi:hypothetical protein
VVGEPVDGKFFDPAVTTPMTLPPLASEPTRPPFRFLAVFKWELRKGWVSLLTNSLTD